MLRITELLELEERYCNSCGASLHADGVGIHHDDEDWCEDCFNDEFVLCAECEEEYVHHEDAYVVDGDYWCPTCADRFASYCDCCEEYTSREMYETYTGDYVCESCRERYYYCCEECGDYVHSDDMQETDDGRYLCPDCYSREPRLLQGWHAHKGQFKFFGKGNIGLGFELEVDAMDYNGTDRLDSVQAMYKLFGEHCYYETDGSLRRGFEIVSNPHTWEEFCNLPIEMACQILINHKWESHNTPTCGLHVHVSRLAFGKDVIERNQNIAKMIMMYSHNPHFVYKLSRRNASDYCKPILKYISNEYGIPVDDIDFEDICAFLGDSNAKWMDRYRDINLNNSETVEFRQGKGTLRADSLRAWCEFCYLISINSKKMDVGDTNISHWLEGASTNLKEYIKERGLTLDNLDD